MELSSRHLAAAQRQRAGTADVACCRAVDLGMAEKAVMRSEVAGKGPTCWIELVGQVICCNWSIDRYIKQSEEPRTVRMNTEHQQQRHWTHATG